MRVVVVLLLLGACGESGADDDDDRLFDAAFGGVDSDFWCSSIASCNTVAQTGCCAGEKCAFVLDDPESGAGHSGCVADGSGEIGAACSDPTVAGTSDDCAAGGDCHRDVCREVCTTVDDLCEGVCVGFVDSHGNPNPIEVCLPGCDPLAQDCEGQGEGCYLAGAAVCLGAGTADIGDPCTSRNACLPGMICVGTDMGGFFCRSLCGPWSDCVEASGEVIACGCGDAVPCAPTEVCFAISNGMGGAAHETAGVCVPATDAGCDCASTPICAPAPSSD